MIELGRMKMLHNLIRHGADVNLVYKNDSWDWPLYTTPLCECIHMQNIDMLHTLLNNGAHINGNKNNVPPLHRVVSLNNIEMVRILIKRGANINHKFHRMTPLHISIRNQDINIARELILSGASIDSGSMTSGGKFIFDTAKEKGVYDELMDIIDQRNKLFKIQGLSKIYQCKKLAYLLRLEPENLFDPEFTHIRKQKLEIDSSMFKNS